MYRRAGRGKVSLNTDPFQQFDAWFEDARRTDFIEPNAAALATADARGRPSLRTVLIRRWDRRGFAFFTNYQSRKGHELGSNPHAALLFFWDKLSRQIRIEGPVEKLPQAESDAYFESRPRGHRISAWVSEQSRVISGREELENKVSEIEARFPGEVPRPPHWGGYRVLPERFEFWEARPNRLHDRLVYRRDGELWLLEQLAP